MSEWTQQCSRHDQLAAAMNWPAYVRSHAQAVKMCSQKKPISAPSIHSISPLNAPKAERRRCPESAAAVVQLTVHGGLALANEWNWAAPITTASPLQNPTITDWGISVVNTLPAQWQQQKGLWDEDSPHHGNPPATTGRTEALQPQRSTITAPALLVALRRLAGRGVRQQRRYGGEGVAKQGDTRSRNGRETAATTNHGRRNGPPKTTAPEEPETDEQNHRA